MAYVYVTPRVDVACLNCGVVTSKGKYSARKPGRKSFCGWWCRTDYVRRQIREDQPKEATCIQCEKTKASKYFGSIPSGKLRTRCRNCIYENDRFRGLQRRYGADQAWIEATLLTQDGKCGVCKEQLTRPHVDHNHKTGALRGLLCLNCNAGIGQMKERADILRAAADYLDRNGG